MDLTPIFQIPYFDGLDDLDLEAGTAAMADRIDDVLVEQLNGFRQIYMFSWINQAQKDAQTGMREGDIGYRSDLDRYYNYTGAVWQTLNNDVCVPTVLTPASGTATVGTSGQLILTGVGTSLNVQGVFSAKYTDYEITLDLVTSGAATIGLQLAVGGVAAATNYDLHAWVAVGITSPTPGQATAQDRTQTQGAAIAGARHLSTWRLSRPFLAVSTHLVGTVDTMDNPMTAAAAFGFRSAQHRTASSYDGFFLIPSTGTLTGTVTIKGIG